MVQRLTYRKRHSYATKSNQHRVVKTPGGKLVYQTTKKRASGPKCPVTGKRIQGGHGIVSGRRGSGDPCVNVTIGDKQ
ncbi:hypothetical protein POPTR_012G108301v4 [Populus trichocarpa]|uniref:Ribosomal protein L34e n=1 Tax=Populus trichocarpa TaxID=3694 RepID=A0A3N7HCE4_POPTR|nr:hypothetical protein POPTR_012G108301v4 [Populus trichocarpa]